LSDLVQREEIGRSLRHRQLDRSIGELINLARNRGGHDNITVAAIRVPGKRAFPTHRVIPRVLWAALVLVLLAAAAALFFLYIAPGLH
jgi:hypothetical protein